MLGITEAEVIRRAIDTQVVLMHSGLRDQEAWEREMADRVLIDTNILLYAYDRAEPVKQPKALAVLDRLVTWRIGVLTPQVLAEFFVNATHITIHIKGER